MVTLEDTLKTTLDWAVDRLHTLCQDPANDPLECVENAHALHCEFFEWLDPDVELQERSADLFSRRPYSTSKPPP